MYKRQDPETKMVHFIGKDNIVFHCIVFPAMLRAVVLTEHMFFRDFDLFKQFFQIFWINQICSLKVGTGKVGGHIGYIK